jgi:hypothetical protein
MSENNIENDGNHCTRENDHSSKDIFKIKTNFTIMNRVTKLKLNIHDNKNKRNFNIKKNFDNKWNNLIFFAK